MTRSAMMRSVIILTLAVFATGAAAHTAHADVARQLAACQAAADAAGVDPTRFTCAWPAVTRGAAGAALTGRFTAVQRGMTGTMTILEGGQGPSRVGIISRHRASGKGCRVKMRALRTPDDVLIATPDSAGACSIKVRSNGHNTVGVTATGCQWYCDPGADFTRTWRLTSN